MKYDLDTALKEVKTRGKKLKRRKQKEMTALLSIVSAGLAFILLICVSSLSAIHKPGFSGAAFGTFLLPGEAGGYILAAVAAFVLGVIITLFCVRIRQKDKDIEKNE